MTFDQFTLTHSSLILNFIAQGHLWAGNGSAQMWLSANFCNRPRSASDKLAVDSPVLLVWGWVLFRSKRAKECLSNQTFVNPGLVNFPIVYIFNNKWMRLSIFWRIMEIEESVISCFKLSFRLVLSLETSEISAIFVFTTKTTQPRPLVFSVKGALTWKEAALLTSLVD